MSCFYFLKEIENHLDKDTEGYDVVLDAIDTMQRVAWHINDMKRKHEHAVRLQVSPRQGARAWQGCIWTDVLSFSQSNIQAAAPVSHFIHGPRHGSP
jgi:hypothetical protein